MLVERIYFWLVRLWRFVFRRALPARPRPDGWGYTPGTATSLGPLKALPAPPTNCPSPRRGIRWLFLGNDKLGDCVFAGLAHAVMAVAWHMKLLASYLFTNAAVSSDYLDWNHGADVGCVPPAVMNAWAQDSMDAKPFYGWGSAGPFKDVAFNNLAEVQSAIAIFKWVGLAINLQQAQEDQWSAGQRWTFVPGSPSVGGHFIILTGFTGARATGVSWGTLIEVDWSILERLCEGAWTGVLPPQTAHLTTPELTQLYQYASYLPPAT